MNKGMIGLIVSILFLGAGGGLFGGFHKLLGRAEKTEEEVKEIKADVEKVDEEVDQEENINIQQQMLIEGNTKLIEKQSKVLDLLIEKVR